MWTTGRFTVDGKELIPPIEAVPNVGENGIFVEASFGEDNIQPSITPLEFTFANQGAKQFIDFVSSGRIFQGVDFSMEVIGDSGEINVINGYLDLTDGYKEISPVEVKVRAKFKESTTSISEKGEGITIDLLKQEGFLTDSDLVELDYVVEKPINAVEVVVATITIFLMTKELTETVEKISQDTATVLGLTSTAATGGVGAIVYQVAIIIVRAAYAAVMLAAITKMMIELLTQFISPIRQVYGFSLRRILEVGFTKLGYDFESPINELEYFTYVPSIRTKSEESNEIVDRGIPSSNDYGYRFAEIVQLARNYFNARIAVIDGKLQFRSENDEYWLRQSTYTMPDVLLDEENPKEYNTDEMVKSRILQFKLDTKDTWTDENYKGTQYKVVTQHTEEVDSKTDGLVGFEYIRYNLALGNVKENLNALEILLKVLAKTADAITSTFGANQNFTEKVERRVGMLKISHESTSTPKLIYYKGGRIPFNHRELLSAKRSWEDYNNYKSFVDNNFCRQRIRHVGVTFGFGLGDFLQILRNSYFYLDSGRIGKFTNLKWDWESDQVIADFWIKHVYADKLKELKTEQNG